MKIAMGAIGRKEGLKNAHVDPIPGQITAEIRKSWKLTGTLALACPEVLDENGEVRIKDEIRSLTHLHHALDAAILALAAYYFPLRHHGQNQSGKIWQALMKRRRSDEEKKFLHGLGIFDTYPRPRRDGQGNETDVRLRDLPAEIKNALARSLAQARVMQHLPADRSGTKAELTTWGVTGIEGEGEDARVSLRQQASMVENGRRVSQMKTREERAGKLLGTSPKDGLGKLKAISGAMIIGENYGIALEPYPTVIPFHNVTARLEALENANGNRKVRVLRNGMLIRFRTERSSGTWQIRSIKNSTRDGILLDLSSPQMIPYRERGKSWCWRDVSLKTIINADLEILPQRYTGHPLNH